VQKLFDDLAEILVAADFQQLADQSVKRL